MVLRKIIPSCCLLLLITYSSAQTDNIDSLFCLLEQVPESEKNGIRKAILLAYQEVDNLFLDCCLSRILMLAW